MAETPTLPARSAWNWRERIRSTVPRMVSDRGEACFLRRAPSSSRCALILPDSAAFRRFDCARQRGRLCASCDLTGRSASARSLPHSDLPGAPRRPRARSARGRRLAARSNASANASASSLATATSRPPDVCGSHSTPMRFSNSSSSSVPCSTKARAHSTMPNVLAGRQKSHEYP